MCRDCAPTSRLHHRVITVGLGLLFAVSAFAASQITTPMPEEDIILPFGVHLRPDISIGQLGIGLTILVQIGRWGRHTAERVGRLAENASKVPDLERRAEILEARADRLEDRLGLPAISKAVHDWFTPPVEK